MKKVLFVFLVCFLFTMGMGSHAATINVPADQPTISAAVTAAAPGDTINITTSLASFEAVAVSKDLIIQGQGVATEVLATFTFSAGVTATIQQLTVNGNNNANPISVNAAGVNLTVSDVTVKGSLNNNIRIAGGSTATITNVTGETSPGNGIAVQGGANTITVTGSTFTGNALDAIRFTNGGTANATITNCNLGGASGSGIRITNSPNTVVTVNGGTLNSNNDYGVTIDTSAGNTVNLTGSSMIGNATANVNLASTASAATINVTNGTLGSSTTADPITVLLSASGTNAVTLDNCNVFTRSTTRVRGTGTYNVTINNSRVNNLEVGAGSDFTCDLSGGGATFNLDTNNTDFLGSVGSNWFFMSNFPPIGEPMTVTIDMFKTTVKDYGLAWFWVNKSTTTLNMDQCTLVNNGYHPAFGGLIANMLADGASVVASVIRDSVFVNYTQSVDGNANVGSSVDVNYCLFADNGGTNGVGDPSVTFGANNVVSNNENQFFSNTFGSPDYLVLNVSSPGATLNSGNGPETYAGAKGAKTVLTVSKNPGDGAMFDTVNGALNVVTNGDIIRILDSSTYQEDFIWPADPIQAGAHPARDIHTLTIEAAAGQTPILEKNSGTGQVFRYNPTAAAGTFTIRGAAPATPITIRNAATTSPVLNTGDKVAGTHAWNLQNVVVERPTSGTGSTGGLLLINNAANHVFDHVSFLGRVTTENSTALTLSSAGSMTFTDCTITPNVANTPNYVHMVASASTGPITMTNCLIAPGAGSGPSGSVLNIGTTGLVTLDGCTINNPGGDRGISFDATTTLNATNCDFNGALAITAFANNPVMTITNCDFLNVSNAFGLLGAAPNVTISGCTINTCIAGQGIWCAAGAAGATLNITNTTITNTDGAGLLLQCDNATATLTGCNLSVNKWVGIALHGINDILTLSNTTITGYGANGIEAAQTGAQVTLNNNSVIDGTGSTGAGVGIVFTNANPTLTINNASVINDQDPDAWEGTGIKLDPGATNAVINATNATINNNNWAGVLFLSSGAVATFTDSTFGGVAIDCDISFRGGANTVTTNNCTFTGTGNAAVGFFGGTSGAVANINGGTITKGGYSLWASDSAANSTFNVNGTTFVGPASAVFLGNDGTNAIGGNFTNCTFNNVASHGAIVLFGPASALTATGCTFNGCGNWATIATLTNIPTSGQSVVVDNCAFNNNVAHAVGFSPWQNATNWTCAIRNSTANGGANFVEAYRTGTMTIENCNVTNMGMYFGGPDQVLTMTDTNINGEVGYPGFGTAGRLPNHTWHTPKTATLTNVNLSNLDNCLLNDTGAIPAKTLTVNGGSVVNVGDIVTRLYTGSTLNLNNLTLASNAACISSQIRCTEGRINANQVNFAGAFFHNDADATIIEGIGANFHFTRCNMDLSIPGQTDFNFINLGSSNATQNTAGLVLEMTNCIVKCDLNKGNQFAIFDGTNVPPIPSRLRWVHNTFYGGTANIYCSANSTDVIFSKYNIFDMTAGGVAVNGTATGPQTLSEYDLAWKLSGPGAPDCGWWGIATRGATHILQDPKLDATGHLTAGSAALGAAVGSTLAVDYDGDARPAGNTVSDVGADESALLAPVFGWPINVKKIAGTAPTIDGNLAAGEWSEAEVVDMRLSTLTAPDPFTAGVNHQGTYLPVNGTITNDADASGLYYILYTNSGLYIAADVSDENLSPSSGATPNAGDAFQICLDYDQTNAPDAQVAGAKVYIPTYRAIAGSGTAPVANTADFHAFWPTSSPNPMTGTTWATTTHAAGFRTETFIPWTAFTAGGDTFTNPFPPAAGQTCGTLVMIDDHDGGAGQGISFMYTSGNGANIIVNASQYNDLIFVAPLSIDDWAQY